MKSCLVTTLAAIVATRSWTTKRLRDWGDRLLGHVDIPASWVLELSNCSSFEEADAALSERAKTAGIGLSVDLPYLLAGMWYIQLGEGVLDRARFDVEICELLDSMLPFELAGALDVEEWKSRTYGERELPEDLRLEFDGLAARSRSAMDRLSTATPSTDEAKLFT